MSMNQPMNSDEYEDYLASFDEAFAEAPIPTRGSMSNVPDGKYQVSIDKAMIRTNSNTGSTELALQLKVMTGEHAGRIIFHQRELDNPERMSYLRGDLNVIGVDIARLSELPKKLNQMLDVVLEVNTKTKKSKNDPTKEYQNCYLNKRLSDGADGPFVGDDLPF